MAESLLGVSGPCCPRVGQHLAWIRPGFAEREALKWWQCRKWVRTPACKLQELSAV